MQVLISTVQAPGPLYHRAEEPARAVDEADLGVAVTTAYGLETTMFPASDGRGLEVREVDAQGADVVVLQLPKTLEQLQMLRVLQSQGIAVVVEMDDLASALPFGHPAYDQIVRQGRSQFPLQCALEADFVTVSTPALLEEYAPHGRGMVVPNAVPRRIAELPPAYERDAEVVTIGWSGNLFLRPYDLQEVGSGLQQALDRTRGRSRFVILGQKGDARDRMRLPEEPVEVPWVNGVDQYLTTLGELFDIGIAPLRIDRFNTCKSWLKPLEYAARGVHSVRSRTEEYERLGVGHPARATKDWAHALASAVENDDRRRTLAAAAREKVLAQHLTEHTAELWATAWRRALEHRARTRPTGVVVRA